MLALVSKFLRLGNFLKANYGLVFEDRATVWAIFYNIPVSVNYFL